MNPQEKVQPYGGQPYPPMNGQQPYPPMNGQQPYPPMNGQQPYPPMDSQQQYPPNNGGQPYYPPNNGQQQPATAFPKTSGLPAKWQFGLFDCCSPFSLCCLTCWCPCITSGKTHALENGEQNPSGFNGMCLAYCLLTYIGGQGILQCINRGNMGQKYGMDTNACMDCLVSCCCGCCALIQEQKEAIVRNTGMDPKTNQPYQPVGGMNYA